MSLRAAITLAALVAAPAAAALDLPLPTGASETARETLSYGSDTIALSAWSNGTLETVEADGAVTRRAWRIPSSSLTPLQLVTPIREALEEQGYRILLDCADRDCGGFDFRFRLRLLPEPDMHVDLGDFRYLAAERPTPEGPERAAIVASRGNGAGYLHLTRVEPATAPTPRTVSVDTARPEPVEAPTADADAGPLAAQLLSAGHSVLTDLNFATGAAELEEADYASLRALAEFLTGRPGARVVLVGHTDSEGDLDANVALSRRRAAAVAERLVQAYGVNPGQVSADGVGYLSPLAPNDTPEGRKLNRRVEAVLLAVAEAE